MRDVDLVCIDVDGTLVGSSGDVLPPVWQAAARAREAGLHLALCSGRPAFGMTRGLAQRLDPSGWHIFQNGASVKNLGSGESRSRALPAPAIAMLVERARATGRVLELYTDDDYAVESCDDRARLHADLLAVPFRTRSYESIEGSVVRAVWVVSPEDARTALAEPHPGLTLSPSVSPVMPGTVFINMTAEGVDKTSAVRAVAEAYGVHLARVMMVGDAENDVGPMRVVGHPIAMGNADPGVRAAARFTVGHVDNAGLVEALALALSFGG